MTTSEQTKATDAPSFEIVPAAADALAYVLSTWGRIVEKKLEATPQPGFLKAFAPFQARIIKRSKVLTAMKAGKIIGFCVFEANVLHWIVVRDDERRKGVGRALLAQSTGTYPSKPIVTFWTSDLRHLGLAEAPYTPFWLRT